VFSALVAEIRPFAGWAGIARPPSSGNSCTTCR